MTDVLQKCSRGSNRFLLYVQSSVQKLNSERKVVGQLGLQLKITQTKNLNRLRNHP